MTKVNPANWPQLDFLINNFYEIVEYKRGRGVYGDRVILKRQKHAEAIFGEPQKLCEFYYLDANAVKELPRTILEKIKIVTRVVTTPEDMNVLTNFNTSKVNPIEWAIENKHALIDINSTDFEVLNNILIERYKMLDNEFLLKLNNHRERQYFLASSDEFNFITKEYAEEQLKKYSKKLVKSS